MSNLPGLPNLTPKKTILRNPDFKDVANVLSGANSRTMGEQSGDRTFDLLMAGFEALDLINIGLAVIGTGGNLLLANHTAEQVLELRDGVELNARGIIRTSRKSTPALEDLIKQAGSLRDDSRADSILAIQRPSGRRPMTLLIRGVEGASGKQDSMTPAALLFILDPEGSVATAESELRQLYGLTSMEASLANLLMEGKTVNECCDLLGIRRSTARTHLQHLFEKVGVQRQSELVSVLLKSIGLVRVGRKPVRKALAPRSE